MKIMYFFLSIFFIGNTLLANESKDFEPVVNNDYSFENYLSIGNEAYREGDFSTAILNYEKALLLSPSNKNVRKNLRLANDKLELFDENMESDIHILKKSTFGLFNPKTWFYLALIIALAFCYLLYQNLLKRKISNKYIAGLIVSLLLSTFCFLASIFRTNDLMDNPYYISPTIIQLYSSPDERSNMEAKIPKGAKMKKIDQLGEWIKVEVGFTNEGWLKSNSVNQIVI
jgi:tetratricopeptide (TPR) repeat protein